MKLTKAVRVSELVEKRRQLLDMKDRLNGMRYVDKIEGPRKIGDMSNTIYTQSMNMKMGEITKDVMIGLVDEKIKEVEHLIEEDQS